MVFVEILFRRGKFGIPTIGSMSKQGEGNEITAKISKKENQI